MEPWKGERCRGRAAAGANKTECRRSRSAPPGKRTQELTPRERRVTEVRLFVWLAMADADAYIAMTEDEVEEEYRRAGKLHRYNPDNEWQKRLARLARKWPPPDGFIPEIHEYLKLLDDRDRDEDEAGEGAHRPNGHGEKLDTCSCSHDGDEAPSHAAKC